MPTTLTLFQQNNATTPASSQPALFSTPEQSALMIGLIIGASVTTCLIACLCIRRALQSLQSSSIPIATPLQASSSTPHAIAIDIADDSPTNVPPIPYHVLSNR